jgi:hypothetical protein
MASVKFLVAVFLLVIDFLTIPQVIAVTCDNEQRIDGTLDSVSIDPLDPRSGDVIVDGLTLIVDPDTILNNVNGDRITLSEFQTDELVRARFCPDTPPQPTAALSSTRTGHSILGNAPPTDFGPVRRAEIDYDSGSATSTDNVTLTRSTAVNPPQAAVSVLPVQWQLSSDRSDFTANITFRYTDAELGTADEGRLVVFASSTGAVDSWVMAGNLQQQDVLRNEITVIGIDSFSLFVIAEADQNVAPTTVDLGGTIRTTEGLDICAMVLASGQFMFSCNPVGVFSLTDLPRENDGTEKRQIYADGFFPKIDILTGSSVDAVVMTRSGSCPSYNTPYDPGVFPGSAGNRINITGKVLLQNSQTPICAMVLANGQHIFSCDGTGSYALNIPLDTNGQFKLQVYADGFAPTIQTFDEFQAINDVRMARAVECL